MKNNTILLILLTLILSCDDNDTLSQNANVTLLFTHHWDGTTINASDFNDFKFTNKNGEQISINRLRYVLSNISVAEVTTNYQLINIGEASGLSLKIDDVQTGNQPITFTFGFADTDNQDGIYQDLNAVSFNVPTMLGGGYHYMQFDGKYKDTNNLDANFNYHTIRAVNRNNPDNLQFKDTSFTVNLGTVNISNNTTIEIQVNIAEWFKNPNTWNLNNLNTVLMPNFEAQKLMSANGKTVFSLGNISQ
ncbi:hypothetical protein DUT90_09305 [Polaribacter sp. WD7]|uniref:MbnP family protein n=1 Tax=Polaribacter sp. WD7 TaxID=2269061 RepID=UPI000DF3C123|nr:MbnP family protein [Polaribacter sp. WD7]RCS25968.1 hypothetical protein DUT90_09305 [Polaribacter sp. WD7]